MPKPAPVLPDAVAAPRSDLETTCCGRIAVYADERGGGPRPLLLVHSVNAAPSTFEVKPIFERYAGGRPVYSLDLPGFGHSERGPRDYTPELYANAINAVLERVVRAPADVLALSLGSEFAARAAIERPQGFASLTIISPTGFYRRSLPPLGVGNAVHGMLGVPVLSQRLFELVASRPSIRYYLGKSFVGEPPKAILDTAYATSHQPGARFAPLTFLSTKLFTRQAIDNLYAKLTELPVLAIADLDPYVTFEHLPEFAAVRPNWRYETLAPHMGLPHWERPTETFALLDAFWASV